MLPSLAIFADVAVQGQKFVLGILVEANSCTCQKVLSKKWAKVLEIGLSW
jgi:hypothetical protein